MSMGAAFLWLEENKHAKVNCQKDFGLILMPCGNGSLMCGSLCSLPDFQVGNRRQVLCVKRCELSIDTSGACEKHSALLSSRGDVSPISQEHCLGSSPSKLVCHFRLHYFVPRLKSTISTHLINKIFKPTYKYIIQWVNQILNGREIFISEQVNKLFYCSCLEKIAIYDSVPESKSAWIFHKEVALLSG